MLFTGDFEHTHTKKNNYVEFLGGGIAGEEEERGSNLEAVGGGASKVALTGDRFLTRLSKPSALG